MRILLNTLRNLQRNPINSVIIVLSLAIGFACINLITTYLAREFTTDNFHRDKDRIFSVLSDNAQNYGGGKTYSFNVDAANYIKSNFPQIEDACGYTNFNFTSVLVGKNNFDDKIKILSVTPNFFEFFSYPLLMGNPKLMLENNDNIVISEKLAQKYFGKKSPLGKTIEVEVSSLKYKYEVSGVFKNFDQNSQLKFDMVVNIGSNYYINSYVKLNPQTTPGEVEQLLTQHTNQIPEKYKTIEKGYYLNSLKDTYFDMYHARYGSGGDCSQNKNTLWIILSVGVLIMVLAMFNFLGIMHYNMLDRAKDFSIFRLHGAHKTQITKIILLEVFALLSVSFLLGLLLTVWILPIFNLLIKTSISADYSLKLSNLLLLISVFLLNFLIISVFVIFKLNSIINFSTLKGDKIQQRFQLPALNIFQLAATIILIISSVTIIKQIQYIKNKPLGVDKYVLDLSVPGKEKASLSVLKSKLLESPYIKSASITSRSLFDYSGVFINYEDHGIEKNFVAVNFVADEDFVKTLGIKVVEGEDFSSSYDSYRYCLINEAMAKKLNKENLIGEKLREFTYPIKGIVKDFIYGNIRQTISPAFIVCGMDPFRLEDKSRIYIKAGNNQEIKALHHIKKVWKEILPEEPLEIKTVEQQYLINHAANNNILQLVILCCAISILISMMGLFAIVLQNSKLRIKEIGIRKVNGAKITEVITLLNMDFIKWVVIAFIIAAPVSWYIMQNWLENFAYRTQLDWWVFALSGFLAMVITLFTVSAQSWKTAARNPVEALRYE